MKRKSRKIKIVLIVAATMAAFSMIPLFTHPKSPEVKTKPREKMIALTFDDGPNPKTTPKLLEELQAAHVHATFFEIGKNVAQYPEITKALSDAGNDVASHTWNHIDLTTLTPISTKNEIDEAASEITKITDKNMPFYRPPKGRFDSAILKSESKEVVTWSQDTGDWATLDTETTIKYATLNPHDNEIILMHDIYPQTVAAVPAIIKNLEQRGYTLVTVSQLIENHGGFHEHQSYMKTK